MTEKPLGVLYLDDNVASLSEVSLALSAQGHVVRTASTVAEAVPWLAGSDVVIIDFHMPGINGAQALLALRRQLPAGGPDPLYYLYTVDTRVAVEFRAHGFNGAFTDKGNLTTLLHQFATAARLLKLRRFVKDRAGPARS